MNLQRFIVILVLVVVMGLVLVYQHAKIIHAGYQMGRLAQERENLNDQQRKLAAELAALKRPDVVAARARTFGIQLVPMEQKDKVMVSGRGRTGAAGPQKRPATAQVKKVSSQRRTGH